MNIPTSFLPTSFETPIVPKSLDQEIPAADEFSSLMAAIWCGPATVIAPTQEPAIVAEPAELPIKFDGEVTLDKELAPLPDVVNSISVKGTGVEVPRMDIGLPKPEMDIDLPKPKMDIELPKPKMDIDLPQAKPVSEAVGAEKTPEELDRIETLPIVTFEDKKSEGVPVAVPKQDVRPVENTKPVVVTVEATRPQKTSGFTRLPVDLEPAPVEPKVITPFRRIPELVVDQASPTSELPTNQPIEISIEGESRPAVENPNPKPLPHDQLTAEAIKREANLAASYLAQTTRESRDGGLQAIKAQVAEIRPEVTKVEAPVDLKESSSQQMPFQTNANGAVEIKASAVEASEVVAQLTKPILEVINTTPPKQTRSIRIRLRPEELGQVDVQLSRDAAGKVSAQMLVERENARQILSQTLPQLKQTLEQAGLVVDQLNVSSDSSAFTGGASNQERQPAEDNSRAAFVQSNQANTSNVSAHDQVRDHKLLSLNA